MEACKKCGCAVTLHSEDGCHSVQHLTPWDRETCLCTLTPEEARK